MKVKICGITNLEDALAACDAGADALGFVFAPEAKARNRYIEPDQARAIIEKLPPFVMTVAVIVNEPPEKLIGYAELCDRVQLCGDETFDNIVYIDKQKVIKAYRVGPDFEPAHSISCPASAYLLDAYCGGFHGGTGIPCDWEAARRAVDCGLPVILAGGLTPDNVAQAIRAVRPLAVDTSGGVEAAPGKKDHDKVRRFIENAKNALP
ncbi:MAG TPA: phosphoribosylanthranilate isomerase [Candidatus Bathyarchaeia archaeon]|nr:phosphoribosylanthranilate isomerase [Candidatus Bathyarchaeia archaeon]